jgi:hypothetical protein
MPTFLSAPGISCIKSLQKPSAVPQGMSYLSAVQELSFHRAHAGQRRTPGPELLSLRLALRSLYSLGRAVLQEKSRKTAEPRVHRGGTDPLKERVRIRAASAGCTQAAWSAWVRASLCCLLGWTVPE